MKPQSNRHIEIKAIHKIAPLRRGLIVKKILRSKKLTKLFTRFLSKLKFVSVNDFLSLNSNKKIKLIEASPIEREYPNFFGDKIPKEMAVPNDPTHFPRIDLIKFKQCTVRGHSNLIITKNKILHHDLLNIQEHTLSEELDRRINLNVGHTTGSWFFPDEHPFFLPKAASFNDAVSKNYAHWLTEVLPRLIALESLESASMIPYIIDADLHENIYRSLELVVSSDRKIYLLPKDRQILVDELWHVSPSGYIPFGYRGVKSTGHSHGIFSSNGLKSMVDLIKNRLNVSITSTQRKKIFVKRNSSLRNLINAKEIENIFLSAGFEILEPECLTFDQQVKLFSSAEIIVGATGAALANIIFASSSCKIFILIARHVDMPYFYWQNMASSVGVQINYILGEPAAKLSEGFHADFLVHESQIHALLSSLQKDEATSSFNDACSPIQNQHFSS